MLTFNNSGSWWNSNRQMHWKKVGSRDREDLPFEEFPSRDRGGSSKTYNPSWWHWGKGMISHHKSERERKRLGLLYFEKSSTFSWLLLISCISASNIFLWNFLKVKSRLEIYKKNAEAILSIYANIMKKVFLHYRYFYNFFPCLVLFWFVDQDSCSYDFLWEYRLMETGQRTEFLQK